MGRRGRAIAKGHRVGVISDTHGLLRPEAIDVLRGSDRLVHAGDVGDPGILDALRRIAPLTAIRGNVDRVGAVRDLPATAILEVGGVSIYVLHDLAQLDLKPGAAGIGVVVTGHTHAPEIRERDGVLYLNPGSAGPKRFQLPVSVAELIVENGRPRARLVELDV